MTLTTNPIIVIKVRMQTKEFVPNGAPGTNAPPKVLPTIRKIYHTEGFSGFYRGLVPGLLCSPHGAIQWTIYEAFKYQAAGIVGSEQATVFLFHIFVFPFPLTYSSPPSVRFLCDFSCHFLEISNGFRDLPAAVG